MTILDCHLVYESISGASAGSGTNAAASYLIETEDEQGWLTTMLEAQTQTDPVLADPLPTEMDPYDLQGETNTTLHCSSVELKSTQNKRIWKADVKWTPLPSGQPPGGSPSTPPDLRDGVVWVEFVTMTEPIYEAWNIDAIPPNGTNLGGKQRPAGQLGPIVNTCLQKFDEPLYQERRVPQLVIQRYFNNYLQAINWNNTYDRSINQSAMFGGAVKKHCALYAGCTCDQPIVFNNVQYWRHEIRITLSDKEWYERILNTGLQWFQEDPKNPDTYVCRRWKLEGTPRLLTEDGAGIPPGEDKVGSFGSYFIPYRTYKEADYAPLEALLP